jgi:hypothetical protein
MTDEAILESTRKAFARCTKPEHFVDHGHCQECPECREHDDLLRSRDIDTLTIKDVGNCGSDPLCVTSPKGFAYFFPALARLVLQEPAGPLGWYGPQLLFHLTHPGQAGRFRNHFSIEQKQAVVALLNHIGETRRSLLEAYLYVDALQTAIDLWSI